jgi:hypothetical protein
MIKLLSKLQKYFFPLILVFITIFLAWQNIPAGSWLSGWDSLHPEFNFPLYFERIFYGVWQEHQGVGAVASQSHAGEFIHLMSRFLLSFVLPLNLLRYIYFFIFLGIGAVGVYFLSQYLLRKHHEGHSWTASAVSALFYMLNLTAVQQFSVPLEMFAVHFGTLPWLFYFAIRYVRENHRKYLLWFSIVTLFSASSAHTATLYYVYVAAFSIFLLTVFLTSFTKTTFKKTVLLLSVTFLLNAYWMLPNFYFIARHGREVADSKIHSIFSDEAFLQGKNFGDSDSLILQKNFLFNWRAFDHGSGQFTDLLGIWERHLENPYVNWVGYFFAFVGLVGIFLAIKRKEKYLLAFLPPFFLAIVFWVNANGPLEPLFNILRDRSILFREGLRFPFTKFSILYSMCVSLFFAVGLQQFFRFLSKVKAGYFAFFLTSVAVIYFSLPSFNGYFIAPNVKTNIPGEYFELFDWFESEPKDSRIVKLPMHTFWGWNYYDWKELGGYEGAGFTWFGLPQATYDREFDRWSHYNEDFYLEASHALYSNDLTGLERVLDKFDADYLLLDESVSNPGGTPEILAVPQIKALLSASEYIKPVKSIGFLTVYKADFGSGRVTSPSRFVPVASVAEYTEIDPIYKENGDYVTDPSGIVYPFTSFGRLSDTIIRLKGDGLVFENRNTGDGVVFPADKAVKEDLTIERGFPEAYNCDLGKSGGVEKERSEGIVRYRATDGGVSCDYLNYVDLNYKQAYVLRLRGENTEGRSLKIYLYNHATKRMDLEELMPRGVFDEFLFLYPKDIEGYGYTLNFETRSYGKLASENLIEEVGFYPVDYTFLSTVKSASSPSFREFRGKLKINSVRKYGSWAYTVDVKGGGLLYLSQGYEEGWIGVRVEKGCRIFDIPCKGFTVLRHTKVNSWANGWLISDSGADQKDYMVYIFFWPQLLEWGGIILGLVTLGIIISKKPLKT